MTRCWSVAWNICKKVVLQEGGMRDIRSVETKPVEYPAYEVIKPKVDILRLKLAKKLDLEGEEIAI